MQLNTAFWYVMTGYIEIDIISFYNTIGGDEVKVSIQENPDIQETEVVIHCNKVDVLVEKIISAVQTASGRLIGSVDGVIYQIDLSKILYIESVNRKTFLYTENEIYESTKRLYMLEDELRGSSFFRASKAIIINLRKVHSIQPEIGSRLILTMDNGERVVVSRQYANIIKNVLEV